jgi:hypothetical protein
VMERLEKAGERHIVGLASLKGIDLAYIKPNLKPPRRLEQRKMQRLEEEASQQGRGGGVAAAETGNKDKT